MSQGGDELVFAGAARQAEMVRAGEVSATELVGLYLDRIQRLDPQLNAFRVVLAEQAMLEAEQAEARVRAGEERPLLGVPVAIKDEFDVAGQVNTHGTDGFTEPAKADSEMVRRLREAGAIVIGLTLLPEMAICGFTESATYGVTRNPWNPQRTPGGSSGGSGTAVAAGLVPIAAGGDGAGSIRIPAASCGLFGLKPSRGRVSLAPELEGWGGLAVAGCLSRSVLDTALWLDVVSGGSREAEAPPPAQPFVEAVRTPPGKLRVAWSTLAPRAAAPPTVSDEAKGAVAEAAELLSGLGHDVVQRDPDWGGIGNNITARFLGGVAETVKAVPHPERLESRTRGFGRLGGILPRGLYERARGEGRAADAARVNAIFDDHDVLVTPVMGGTALPVRRWEGKGALQTVLGMSRFYPYCVPWNHLGNPAMAVPAGFSPDGMPLSVQVIGRRGDEATLLSLAAQIEAERPWADAKPPIS